DPDSGAPWPALPAVVLALAGNAAVAAGFDGFAPDACLVNRYEPGARLTLHQDKDERDFAQPIVSVSLGVPAVFLFGGLKRKDPPRRLELVHGDVVARLPDLPDAAFDAVLHDPPRFGIAGELYSSEFYAQLARVLRPGGRLFHYTGTPNKLTTGRDVPNEVARRLRVEGFRTELRGDGVLAQKVAG
ncbi:MAG TPA: alpha-ketoglutarate-dependent dioxygenase AlkB, partial [Steroidobacteraceae bacterium]